MSVPRLELVLEQSLPQLCQQLRDDAPGLNSLNLRNNNIGDAGAAMIADALRNNTQLKTLWLGMNNIGDRGAAAIATLLAYNTSLTELNLHRNNIGDEGAHALIEGLKLNCSIRTLVMHWNNITQSVADELDQMMTDEAISARIRHLNRCVAKQDSCASLSSQAAAASRSVPAFRTPLTADLAAAASPSAALSGEESLIRQVRIDLQQELEAIRRVREGLEHEYDVIRSYRRQLDAKLQTPHHQST